MNGAHDMGGVHGFGAVVPEANEPTFHAVWEGRVFALALAAGRPGQWNIDMVRFARENRPPADYLAKSYYEIWLAGLEAMLAERGLVSADEIGAARPLGEPRKVSGILQHGAVEATFSRGRPTEAGERSSTLSYRRPRSGEEHSSDNAHTAAPVHTRPPGHDREAKWLPRLPGYKRARARGEPAMALYRAVRRTRPLGPRSRSNA